MRYFSDIKPLLRSPPCLKGILLLYKTYILPVTTYDSRYVLSSPIQVFCVCMLSRIERSASLEGMNGIRESKIHSQLEIPKIKSFIKHFALKLYAFINTFKYHVFAPMGRFQLESIYLYFPPSSQLLYFSVLQAFRCYNNDSI